MHLCIPEISAEYSSNAFIHCRDLSCQQLRLPQRVIYPNSEHCISCSIAASYTRISEHVNLCLTCTHSQRAKDISFMRKGRPIFTQSTIVLTQKVASHICFTLAQERNSTCNGCNRGRWPSNLRLLSPTAPASSFSLVSSYSDSISNSQQQAICQYVQIWYKALVSWQRSK